MTSDEIWEQLKRKQPKLERSDAVVEITAGNLRRLLRQAYEQGEASRPSSPGPPFFEDFFGGDRGGKL